MFINGYYINDYWRLLMPIVIVVIGNYFIGGYWCLLMFIILVVIGGYSIMNIGDY